MEVQPTLLSKRSEASPPLPRLDHLPEELLSNIANRLDWDDISCLRLSCQAIEAKSFHVFATEYFTSKGFLLCSDSLKVLTGISETKRLAPYLKNVFIATGLFSESDFKCEHGKDCSWSRNVRQAEAYRMYIKDQCELKETGEDLRILTQAFKALPELTRLSFRDARLPGESDAMPPYGTCKIYRRCGRAPGYCTNPNTRNAEYEQWCIHVWKTMCKAVVEMEKPTIRYFEAGMMNRACGLSVKNGLNLDPKIAPKLSKALANLRGAKLTIRGNTLIKHKGSTAYDRAASSAVVERFARILNQPQLEDLDLFYDASENTHLIHVAIMGSVNLANLEKLFIDSLCTTASAMATTLGQLSSIKELHLTYCRLTKGTWIPSLKAIQKMRSLDHLHLMWLQEANGRAYFLKQREADELVDEQNAWMDDLHFEPLPEDDFDSDEMPELDPLITLGAMEWMPHPGPHSSTAPTALPNIDYEFMAPGMESTGERGYYICLKGEEIAKFIPIFIKEYNTDDSVLDHHAMLQTLFGGPPPPGAGAEEHGANGQGPPPELQHHLNGFTTATHNGVAMSFGPPIHILSGPVGGAGVQQQAAAQANTAPQNGGNAQPPTFGPTPPPQASAADTVGGAELPPGFGGGAVGFGSLEADDFWSDGDEIADNVADMD